MSSARIEEGFSLQLPEDVWKELGVEPGDEVSFHFKDGKVFLEPVNEEIEVDLSEALEDVRTGRVHGPFKSARELFDHLNR